MALSSTATKDTDSQNSSSKEFWTTREQIGQLLEYEFPAEAIRKIHQRNEERFNEFSRVDRLSSVEVECTVEREVTVYSFRRLIEIFGNQIDYGSREREVFIYSFKRLTRNFL